MTSYASWIKRPIGITHCRCCGQALTRKQRKNHGCYCSRDCAGTKRYHESCVCPECKKDFRINGRQKTFCSWDCWLAHIGGKPCSEHTKEHAREQRHIKRSIFGQGEALEEKAIYERDGWRCGICGKKVKSELKYPHPLAASLDHIMPLSRGGFHVKANVQLAHLRCNLKKNARGGGQLRLVG